MPTPSFALVTEGITDQKVIENILVGFFDDSDIDIRPLQPLRDETDRNRAVNSGNWHKVLEYCASEEFRGAFQFSDYVIVQIDTDVAADYDVSGRDEEGNAFSDEEMYQRVREKLVAQIEPEFYANYASRILFAVSVQSIECWLLPLFFTDNKKSKTVNCLSTLNQGLKSKKFSIDPDKKNPRYYEDISKDYAKRRKLMSLYTSNLSLEAFIHELETTQALADGIEPPEAPAD